MMKARTKTQINKRQNENFQRVGVGYQSLLIVEYVESSLGNAKIIKKGVFYIGKTRQNIVLLPENVNDLFANLILLLTNMPGI